MFDFVDTSGLPDARALFAEAEARRDPDRELRAPVSIVAGSVVDAVAVLVERGVVADPGPGVAARRDGVGGDDPASGASGASGVGAGVVVEGIATPIDILKAIAGELPDVGSRERPEILTREDGSLLIDGHLSIDELQRTLGRRDMASGEYHTVAGFVLARLGRIPKAGDIVTWRGLRIEVVDMDGKRIDKVVVVRAG